MMKLWWMWVIIGLIGAAFVAMLVSSLRQDLKSVGIEKAETGQTTKPAGGFRKFKEKLSGRIFFLLALSALSALALITIFIIVQAAGFFGEVSLWDFLFGSKWSPTKGGFGILPMIVGTLFVTLGAIVIGVPIGVACAIFLAEFAPDKVRNAFRPAIQLLAGIPSVVYGFVGLIFVVPFIREFIGGPGLSMLAGSVVLAIMILPTVISISEVALLSLPKPYKEGALALGMTQWQSIWRVQIPAAKSGIIASIILGVGRAVGETMAVIMVLGNATAFPESILAPMRTLTTNIGLEMGYAEGKHQQALFATGVVLFVIIMLINSIAQYITRDKLKGAAKKRKKKPSLAVAVAGGVPPEAQITNYNPQTTNADTETAGISQNVNADAGTVGRGLAPAVVGGGPSGAPQISASQLQSAPQGPPRPQPLISSGDKAGRRASPRATQRAAKVIIWAAAVLVLAVLIAIIVYLLIMGVPELTWEFLTQNPRDMGREGGVAATIVSTFVVTGLALLISIPFGIGSAFYLAEYTKENIWTRVIRFSVESLAGIPSIVYGLFGFIIFVSAFGFSALSGGLTLAIMVLPTVIRTSEEAIKTVPNSYRETSFSLGASKWQTVLYAVFPTALRGIVNGVILGIGRCVAETAAVILTAGSALRMRTMASHFFILADEGISMEKAYGTAALLIILILIINVGFNALLNRFVGRDARATKKGKKRLLKAG